MSVKALGIIPRSSSASSPEWYAVPIVNVLPDPVCPYARTVALNPKIFFVYVNIVQGCDWSGGL